MRVFAAMAYYLRFARFGDWWFSKIPPLLAVAYLVILRNDLNFSSAAPLLAYYLFSISCVAIYGHIVNDCFDVEPDQRAGKQNAMSEWSRATRAAFCLAFLCVGFLPSLVGAYSVGQLLLLALNYLWPSIYSLPGIRLKKRGILGVVCDALGSHITPTLLALSLFGGMESAASGRQITFSVVVTLWASVLGLKGILHHQLADRRNDVKSGVSTYVTEAGAESITRFLPWFNILGEAVVSAALVLVVYDRFPLAIIAYGIYCGLETAKYALGFQFSPSVDGSAIRASVPFANELFYILWFPLAAAVQLAVHDSIWFFLPLFHVAAFRRVFALQWCELKALHRATRNATRSYTQHLLKRRI